MTCSRADVLRLGVHGLSLPSFEHLRAAPLLGTHRLSTSLGQVVQPSVVVVAPFPPAVFQRAHRNNHTLELARRTRATANYYKETRSPTGALRTGSRT